LTARRFLPPWSVEEQTVQKFKVATLVASAGVAALSTRQVARKWPLKSFVPVQPEVISAAAAY
jgi:hypothetical protein